MWVVMKHGGLLSGRLWGLRLSIRLRHHWRIFRNQRTKTLKQTSTPPYMRRTVNFNSRDSARCLASRGEWHVLDCVPHQAEMEVCDVCDETKGLHLGASFRSCEKSQLIGEYCFLLPSLAYQPFFFFRIALFYIVRLRLDRALSREELTSWAKKSRLSHRYCSA